MDLTNKFKSNNDIWTYCPNNLDGLSTFAGKPIPSEKILKILGQKGIMDLDKKFKSFNQAQKLLFGKDTESLNYNELQYFFLDLDEEITVKNISSIFRNKTFLICGDYACDNSFDDEHKEGFLKSNCWNKPRVQNIEFFDYFVHFPEDIIQNKETEWFYKKCEWYLIAHDNKEAIERLLG